MILFQFLFRVQFVNDLFKSMYFLLIVIFIFLGLNLNLFTLFLPFSPPHLFFLYLVPDLDELDIDSVFQLLFLQTQDLILLIELIDLLLSLPFIILIIVFFLDLLRFFILDLLPKNFIVIDDLLIIVHNPSLLMFTHIGNTLISIPKFKFFLLGLQILVSISSSVKFGLKLVIFEELFLQLFFEILVVQSDSG